mgnify:CR=1 FL=1
MFFLSFFPETVDNSTNSFVHIESLNKLLNNSRKLLPLNQTYPAGSECVTKDFNMAFNIAVERNRSDQTMTSARFQTTFVNFINIVIFDCGHCSRHCLVDQFRQLFEL